MLKGQASTLVASHLFEVNNNQENLNKDEAEECHRLMAKLPHLSKRTRPDTQTAVSFLTTRVKEPDVDNQKKFGRCIKHLSNTKDQLLRPNANQKNAMQWWVDALFALHEDHKSHTGASMSMGGRCPIDILTKQKINAQSSTEAELVGTNNARAITLWVRNFLIAQGCKVTHNVVC